MALYHQPPTYSISRSFMEYETAVVTSQTLFRGRWGAPYITDAEHVFLLVMIFSPVMSLILLFIRLAVRLVYELDLES